MAAPVPGCGFDAGFNTGFCVAVAEPERMRGVPAPPRERFLRLREVELEGRGFISAFGRGWLTIHRSLKSKARIEIRGPGLLSLEQHPTGEALLELAAAGRLTVLAVLAGEGDQAPPTATGALRAHVTLAGTAPLPALTARGAVAVIPFVYVPAVVEMAGEPLLVAAIARGAITVIPAVYVPAVIALVGEALVIAAVASGRLQASWALFGGGSYKCAATGCAAMGHALEGWGDFEADAYGEAETDDEQAVLAVLGLPSEVAL